MFDKFIFFRTQYISATIVGGWFGTTFRDAFVDFVKWILNGIFDALTPFVEWGCKIFIVWCVILLYCSGDKRNISNGLKCLLIYIVFFLIKGAIN